MKIIVMYKNERLKVFEYIEKVEISDSEEYVFIDQEQNKITIKKDNIFKITILDE